MNLSHQAAFELLETGMARLSQEQRLALEQHLAMCEACRLEAGIMERLRLEAARRWPPSVEPATEPEEMIAVIKGRFQRKHALQRLYLPAPGLAWLGAAILMVFVLSWIILNLIAHPARQLNRPAGQTPEATPTPQATTTSVLSKTPLEPIFEAPGIQFGHWSPSGEFLYFLSQDPKDQGKPFGSTRLHFYNAASGQVCTAGDLSFVQTDASNGFTWLPDGRLLLVDAAGEVLALPICKTGDAKPLTLLFPETVERLYASDMVGKAVLFKGKEAYWLYNPIDDQVRGIDSFKPGFIPGSDHFSWSPSGKRLAASVMNGVTGKEGSRLLILDLESLELIGSLDLQGGEGQSAPWVDWLSEDWLLTPGPEKAFLVSLAGGELKQIDIYRDLFKLEVSHPFDVPSLSYETDEEKNIFHLAVASNIGGAHRIHLYHSEDGRVETLEQSAHTFLFLPNGESLFLSYWETEPTYRDEYEFLWVDSDRPPRRLMIQGHTPRQYPQLYAEVLPRERLAFSSSQGVSLVSVEDGHLLGFWSLEGSSGLGSPYGIYVESRGGCWW